MVTADDRVAMGAQLVEARSVLQGRGQPLQQSNTRPEMPIVPVGKTCTIPGCILMAAFIQSCEHTINLFNQFPTV